MPWKESFSKFLNIIPSSREDVELLQCLLEFLIDFVSLYKAEGTCRRKLLSQSKLHHCFSGIDCWIFDSLRLETNPLQTLLSKENMDDSEPKTVNKELLQLITICVSFEQHYLDLYGFNLIQNRSCWNHVIELIASNLKFSDAQHFYNLGELDDAVPRKLLPGNVFFLSKRF